MSHHDMKPKGDPRRSDYGYLWYSPGIKRDGSTRSLDDLTRPSNDRFPYRLKPTGWTPETDPFEAEARRRVNA